MFIILFAFFQSDLTLKEVKVQDNVKTNFFDLVSEKPIKINFYEFSDSISNKIIMLSYYKNYVNVKVIDYDEFQRRLTLPVISHKIYENKRVEYLIGQTLLGVGLYSWSFPLCIFRSESTDDNSERIRTGTGFLFPFFYFGANFFLTNGKNISSSQAYGSFGGGFTGFVHGLLLFDDIKWVFPISITENFLDNYLCWAFDLTPGVYQRKLNHNIYGYYHYYTLKTLFTNKFERTDNANTFASIISIIEGYGSMFIARNKKNISFGDALFETRTTTIGSEILPAILWTYDNFNNSDVQLRTYAAVSLLGHIGGYWLGDKLTRENDISLTTAILTYLIPSLAHLFTAGVLALSNSDVFLKSYPTIFMITDVGLTYVVYKTFKDLGVETGKNESNNINFGFDLRPDIINGRVFLKPNLFFSFIF